MGGFANNNYWSSSENNSNNAWNQNFNNGNQNYNNKRNTLNALAFEVDYEANFLKLCAEINNGSYRSGKSIAFIVNKPLKREIFATG